MTIKEQLRSNFPLTIDKSKPVFSSLVANDKGTATLEKALTDVSTYMNQWKDCNNVYQSSGTELEYISSFFTYLEKFLDEKESSYLDRIAAIFVRNHDETWGTPWNIIHTFRQYFGINTIYLVENTDDKANNLIKNSIFDDLEDWTVVNAELSKDACFQKTNGILMGDNGSISQTIAVESGKAYWLHSFYKGNCSLSVTGAHSVRWNHQTELYESIPAEKTAESEDWNDIELFFIADGSSVEITISGEEGTYCDYPRLFVKQGTPTFSVMVQFTGESSKNALALAPGKEDPIDIKYNLAGYYDQDFLTGANSGYALDLYKELLSYVKAIGVTAYLEIVNRDSDASNG